jgi:uncharacterized protein (TIGR03435 family)
MRLLASLFLTTILLSAQTPAPVAFEAATIKPSQDAPHHSGTHTRTGLLMIQGQTLHTLIRTAYHLMPNQVEGGPKWAESERYDINAKSEGPAEDPELMRMLQTLLADRFQLTFHTEKKEFPGYALVVAKGGLKIHPVDQAVDRTNSNSNDLHASVELEGATLAKFADILSRSMPMPVVDQTGIAGAFTFKLEWSRDDRTARGSDSNGAVPVDNSPTIFSALQEQLGLKLESKKLPMDVLVIDRAEKPGEN